MGKFLNSFFSPLGFRRAVPQVWDGFQTNIKLMVIPELLVLFFALLVAIVRGLPGRGAFPLRAFAVGYERAANPPRTRPRHAPRSTASAPPTPAMRPRWRSRRASLRRRARRQRRRRSGSSATCPSRTAPGRRPGSRRGRRRSPRANSWSSPARAMNGSTRIA